MLVASKVQNLKPQQELGRRFNLLAEGERVLGAAVDEDILSQKKIDTRTLHLFCKKKKLLDWFSSQF